MSLKDDDRPYVVRVIHIYEGGKQEHKYNER